MKIIWQVKVKFRKEIKMDDLINRSILLNALEKHYESINMNNVPNSIAEVYCQIEKLIKEQPKVYSQ